MSLMARGRTRPTSRGRSGSVALFQLLAQLLFALPQLWRERLTEIIGCEHLANFDLAVVLMRVGAALHPLDRLGEGGDLPQPEAGNQLLGLGERAVGDDALLAGKRYPRAL